MARLVPITEYLWFQEGPGVRNTQYTNEGVKLLNVANFVDGKIDLSTSSRYISENEAYGKYKHFLVDAGDFIIASSGIQVDYFDKKMGFIRQEQLPLCMNTSTIRFKCIQPDALEMRYFMYYLKSEHFKRQLGMHIVGSAQLNFGPSHLKKMHFPYTEIEQQQHIAAVLDKVSELIDLRKRQLAKLDELVKSRFVEMFGDPIINPINYPVCQLSEHITFLTSGSRGWAQYFVDDGTEWFITIKNVKDCRISIDNMQPINAPDNAEARRTKVQEGDLLISITADLGRTGVVTKEIAEHGAYINQHLTCIRLNQEVLNPLYVAYFMESPAGKEQFESKNQSAVKAGLNFNSINSLRLMVPPTEEQIVFVEFVKQLDKSKAVVQQSLDKLETLKKSLMQEYFG